MNEPTDQKSYLGYGSPEALESVINAQEKSAEFMGYREGFLYTSVCSSFSQQEVETRMAARICGTKHGWMFSDQPFSGDKSNPCPCNDHPKTHQHFLFVC